MNARIGRGALIPGIALALAAAACTGDSGGDGHDPTSASSNESGGASASAIMEGWTDATCDVFDPDSVTEQLGIEAYTEGPTALGTTEGNFLGGLKCNSMFDFPDYVPEEGQYDQDLNGWMYQVLLPYASADEAASAYQELYDDAAAQLHDHSDRQQAVDETIEGDWEQGAILASVGPGNNFRAAYQKDSYIVFIEIGYIPDPGVSAVVALKEGDRFANPTYDFTPPELAEWFKSDYLPGLQETITTKLEE